MSSVTHRLHLVCQPQPLPPRKPRHVLLVQISCCLWLLPIPCLTNPEGLLVCHLKTCFLSMSICAHELSLPPGLLAVRLDSEKHLGHIIEFKIQCQGLEKTAEWLQGVITSTNTAHHRRDFPGTPEVDPSRVRVEQMTEALKEHYPEREYSELGLFLPQSWLSLIPRLFRTNSSFVILFLIPRFIANSSCLAKAEFIS